METPAINNLINTAEHNTLACPLDGLPLTRQHNSWHCPAGHSYDRARQGYVNLLPVQHKRSRDPGDSKDMVEARQAFLAAGYYQPLADAVCEAIRRHAAVDKALHVLDAGCGEGYYLRQLQHSGLNVLASGVDISKWAVMAAARQPTQAANTPIPAQWIVGSNANLPLLTASQDVVLCLFGFPVFTEFARVLTPGGLLIKLDPGSDHLLELRQIIYPTLKSGSLADKPVADGFSALEHYAVRYTIVLNTPEMIARLLTMTPHLYRITADALARASALNELELSIDVNVSVFRKIPSATL